MIGTFAEIGWEGALVGTLALAGVAGSGAKTLHAHLTPNYADVVTAAGPIMPGSFHIVGEGETSGGHLVIYTVERPGHAGSGLGALLTRLPTPFARVTVDANESVSVTTGPIRYGVVRLADTNLVYGVVTGGISSLTARTVDAGRQTVTVDPRGGFYLTVPHSDAGALFTPNGG